MSNSIPAFQTVYLYDPVTGALAGMYEAQLSPADNHAAGPVYLAPVHSTPTAPPSAGPNQSAVYSPATATAAESWTLVSDFRGQTAYSQTDGSAVQVQSIGPLPTGYLLTPPPPTVAQQLTALENDVQAYLDSKAAAKGYSNAASCISYLNSGNATWKADATAMNTWRDAVWTFCFANSAGVKTGASPVPTWAQLLAALPAAPW